jgi:hypothetical protein
MASFEINLIKDAVMPRSRRKLVRWALLGYVLCCGAALVTVCYHGTQSIVKLSAQRSLVVRLEQPLLTNAASAHNIAQHVKTLYGDLERTAEKLARADEFLGQRIVLAPILLGLVTPLSPDSSLDNLVVDQKAGSVRLDLIMPIKPTNHAAQSSMLLAAWNNDPHLAKRVQNIRLVTSQQKNIRGRKVFVEHFEGTLRQQE